MRLHLCIVAAALLAAGCATFPTGPSVMVLPGSRMSFDQFRADDFECRSFASQSAGGGNAQQAAENSAVTSAVVGTAIGAVAGAAIGGSHGAGVGAGTGLLFGSVAGSGAANASGYTLQHRYDVGYTQCMYAKGHKVPVAGRFTSSPSTARSYSPPPPPPPGSSAPPPPPPGTYAPPPPPAR
jgi:hypothetical protein